jgi:hypothetical protein
MSLEILFSRDRGQACFVDGCSGTAFGPVFSGDDAESAAQSFLDWLSVDPRHIALDLLQESYCAWLHDAVAGECDHKVSADVLDRVRQQAREYESLVRRAFLTGSKSRSSPSSSTWSDSLGFAVGMQHFHRRVT